MIGLSLATSLPFLPNLTSLKLRENRLTDVSLVSVGAFSLSIPALVLSMCTGYTNVNTNPTRLASHCRRRRPCFPVSMHVAPPANSTFVNVTAGVHLAGLHPTPQFVQVSDRWWTVAPMSFLSAWTLAERIGVTFLWLRFHSQPRPFAPQN